MRGARRVEPPFLTTAIPNASAVERMAVHRAPLGEVAPRSSARKAFSDLWAEIAARCGRLTPDPVDVHRATRAPAGRQHAW